jgi:hypothetical protein
MPTGTRSRFTIARLMVIVAGTALVLGIALTPGVAPIFGEVVIPSVIAGVGIYLGSRRLVELFYGHRCPGCGVRGMERRAVRSFGERFFLCKHCGVRCSRSLLGISGNFFWRDASGPEFHALYDRTKEEDPWNGPPGLEDDNDPAFVSKTHLNLVRSKRQRRPENPNGPGLE